MSEEKEPLFTGEDIEQMARSFGRPPPESLTKKVMAKIDEIDREKLAKAAPAKSRSRGGVKRDGPSRE